MATMDKGGNSAMQSFAERHSASEDAVQVFEEPESNDFIYQLSNSCLQCNKALGKDSIKVIPPRYIQERDPYVRDGVVYKRYMCVPCYNTIITPVRPRSRTKALERQRSHVGKARIIKDMLKSMMGKGRL